MTESSFDLLFTDIIMPEMSGYELAAEVRKKYPEMKIQLTSGYDSTIPDNNDDVILKNNLLAKPYGDVKLLKIIRNTLDHA